MKSVNWKDHFVNLIVVILGISIAFWLESWNESRKRDQQEKLYMVALQHDLENDLILLDTILTLDEWRKEMITSLVEMTQKESTIQRVDLPVESLIYHMEFVPQRSSYEAMTALGNLGLISDFKLRTRIIQLYSQYYRGASQVDEVLTDFSSQYMQPLYIHKVQRIDANGYSGSFLEEPEFLNVVFSYRAVFNLRNGLYKDVKVELEALLEQLKTYNANN